MVRGWSPCLTFGACTIQEHITHQRWARMVEGQSRIVGGLTCSHSVHVPLETFTKVGPDSRG
jgi:hypothetical protein